MIWVFIWLAVFFWLTSKPLIKTNISPRGVVALLVVFGITWSLVHLGVRF